MFRSAAQLASNWTTWLLVHWWHVLVLGFGALLSLIAFVSVISLETNKATEQNLKRIVNVEFRKHILTTKMRSAALERTTSLTQLIFLKDPFAREDALERFYGAASVFLTARHAFMTMHLDNRERQFIKKQGLDIRQAQPYQLKIIEYIKAGDLQKAQETLVDHAIPAQNVTLRSLARLEEYTHGQTRLAMEQASVEGQHERRVILILSLAAGSVGLLVALIVAYLALRASLEREYLATHDTLTGLPNRILILDHLSQALAQAGRNQKLVGVLFIDLDRFKLINDTLGHQIGDELLCMAAQRLRASVRGTDIVCRQSGDEFIVLVQDAAHVNDVVLVAEKILNALRQPYFMAGYEYFTTGSIGISLSPNDGDQPLDLIKHADAAMYQAKEEGRNRYCFFDISMAEIATKRLEMETELRHAIERNELELHYQPQLDVSDGRIVGFEALIRWRHPAHGILMPQHFLALLEETGLIRQVSGQLLLRACRDCRAWQQLGHPDLGIAFNLSASEFWHGGLVDKIRYTLDESGLSARHLTLELTEGILMKDVIMAIQRMEEIKALGVHLSVDDFGTGYSCLAHLKRFPVNEAKVDRYFLSDITHSKQAAEYLEAILALSESLSLQTVIEGVETAEQLAKLQPMGRFVIQGYLISGPVPGGEVEELLARDWSKVVPMSSPPSRYSLKG